MGFMFARGIFLRRADRPALQAFLLWLVFLAGLILLNGTIPFLFGYDLHSWTASTTKHLLISSLVYGGLFFITPLVLTKGWKAVRQACFLVPCLVGLAAITFWSSYPGIAGVVVMIYAYLHWRYDLSALGFSTRRWKGDLVVLSVIAVLILVSALFRSSQGHFSWSAAGRSVLDRLFANPASTVENVFYFGFLTERLMTKTGRWLTPPLIALMYTTHEMTNPEYWYGRMAFGFVFGGIWLVAMLYTWRRSMALIWLGDGLTRLIFQPV